MEPNTTIRTYKHIPNLEIPTMGIYEHKGINTLVEFVDNLRVTHDI